jgi:predicted  nucleic acid-binding Zn-ribbon protein
MTTVTDDIVGKLRTAAIMQKYEEVYCPDLLRKAASEIQSLRDEVSDWKRTVRAYETEVEDLKEKIEDLRMYAEQDECVIESQNSDIAELLEALRFAHKDTVELATELARVYQKR